MFRSGSSWWVSLCSFMLCIFWFIADFLARLKADSKAQRNAATFNVKHSQDDDQVVCLNSTDSVSGEKESPEFSFSFRCQEMKESRGNVAEKEDVSNLQSGYSASTSKYQFMSGKDVCGFMEEPETMRCTVQEMFVGSIDGLISNEKNLDTEVAVKENAIKNHSEEKVQNFDQFFSSGDDSFRELGLYQNNCIRELDLEEEFLHQERAEKSDETMCSRELLEEKEAENPGSNYLTSGEEINDLEDCYSENDDISYELNLLRNELFASDLKPESENTDDDLYAKNQQIQSGEFEVSFDELVPGISSSHSLMTSDERKPEGIETNQSLEDAGYGILFFNREANVNEDVEGEFDDEYIEMDPCSKILTDVYGENLSQKNENLHEPEYRQGVTVMDDGSEKFGEVSFRKESWESDSDDEEDEFDILLEHQKLVQQMKMETKNSKLRVLPTISEEEECETPKMEQDLKPLKIEEKFECKDCMEEIQKFYKSYAEKMRKLDILNYQSLHAINFIKRKDSQLFGACKKASILSTKNFSLLSYGLCKRRVYADPTLKPMSEMHRDLELVYVGQACLSWEILRWQYGKVKELQDLNSQGHPSYSQIAGEYQQFQVLMQRFLEDEPFRGPRIQNYVKSRSFCRSFLQVPIIRDDCSMNEKERLEEENNAISIAELAETIKEAMQVFWEFVRADKDESNAVSKGIQGSLVHLQSPGDAQLFVSIRTCLEKKERKIKDILRSGNCIVKKFQKHQTRQPGTALLMSQVELKLVSRVLNLSRLRTEQLIWCQKKLNSIDIVSRKIHVETAFLLFPC